MTNFIHKSNAGQGEQYVRRQVKASSAGSNSSRAPRAFLAATAALAISLLVTSSAWADGNVSVTVIGHGKVTSTAESPSAGFGGTVTATPGQINCHEAAGPVCSAKFVENFHFGLAAIVTLTATPDSESEFKGWSFTPAASATFERCTTPPAANPTCKVSVAGEPGPTAAVVAEFGPAPPTLTIAKPGRGIGSVKCEVDGGPSEPCAAIYPRGSEVTLTAVPDPGSSEFAGFGEGAGSASACSGLTCTFTIDVNSTVTATFSLIPRALAISAAGEGTGTIRCAVDGGYPKHCAATYPHSTKVVLEATPDAGSTFGAYSVGTGSAASCTGACEFTIEADSAVTASFELIPRALAIATASDGAGSVQCAVGAIPEGPCATTYLNGTRVTLKATPAQGSEFQGWAGVPCTGRGDCTFTIRDDTAARAYFAARSQTASPQPVSAGSGTDGKGHGGSGSSGSCIKRANSAYRKAIKSAKHKRGTARDKAIKAAKKQRSKAKSKCKGRSR